MFKMFTPSPERNKEFDKKTSMLYLEVFFLPEHTKESILKFNKPLYDLDRDKEGISTLSSICTEQGLDRLLRSKSHIFTSAIAINNNWLLAKDESNYVPIKEVFENTNVQNELRDKIKFMNAHFLKTKKDVTTPLLWINKYVAAVIDAIAQVKQIESKPELPKFTDFLEDDYSLPVFKESMIHKFKQMTEQERDQFWEGFQHEVSYIAGLLEVWKLDKITD